MIIKVPSGDIFEATVANGLVTVLNAASGIYQVLFPNNMGKGRLIAEIQLSNSVPEVIVSRKFSIVGDGSLTSDGVISALPQGGKLWEIIQNEEQRKTDFDAILGSLDEEVALKYTELETEYATELNGVKSQLAETKTKADAMASGSPKGVYATLVALQTVKPTGDTGAYLVTADGNWYYWSGASWTSGGVYQAIAISDGGVTMPKINGVQVTTGKNKFDKNSMVIAEHRIDNVGNVTPFAGWSYALIPVNPETIYSFKNTNGWYQAGVVGALGFADSNKTIISYVDMSTLPNSFAGGGKTVTTPINAVYIILNTKSPDMNITDTLQVEQGDAVTTHEPYELNLEKMFNSNIVDLKAREEIEVIRSLSARFSDKIWAILGDSITEVNGTASVRYHDIIAEKLNMTVLNYGIAGTGWRSPSSIGGTDAFHQRINSMNNNADLITVFGGTNDWGQAGITFVLGAITDTDPNVSFYGAVRYTIANLIAKYPTKTIAVFTPLPRDNSWGPNGVGTTMAEVSEALIKVCKMYSVPCLDLLSGSNFSPWDSNFRTAMMPDGLHPNNAGHELLANKILPFIKSL